jgi:hypothetical protein
MLGRALERAGDWLLALAAGAAVLALAMPSGTLARRSDIVLAALVLSRRWASRRRSSRA